MRPGAEQARLVPVDRQCAEEAAEGAVVLEVCVESFHHAVDALMRHVTRIEMEVMPGAEQATLVLMSLRGIQCWCYVPMDSTIDNPPSNSKRSNREDQEMPSTC